MAGIVWVEVVGGLVCDGCWVEDEVSPEDDSDSGGALTDDDTDLVFGVQGVLVCLYPCGSGPGDDGSDGQAGGGAGPGGGFVEVLGCLVDRHA